LGILNQIVVHKGLLEGLSKWRIFAQIMSSRTASQDVIPDRLSACNPAPSQDVIPDYLSACHPGLDPGSMLHNRHLQRATPPSGSRVFARDDKKGRPLKMSSLTTSQDVIPDLIRDPWCTPGICKGPHRPVDPGSSPGMTKRVFARDDKKRSPDQGLPNPYRANTA
jgi:hypothetical protein